MQKQQATVYIIEPEEAIRDAVRNLVGTMNLHCEAFASAEPFLARFDPFRHGCLILEVRIPDINGLEVQARLATSHAQLPLIFLAEESTVSIAVRAMRVGALYFLEKPFREHELWDAIEEALLLDQERRESLLRREQIAARSAELSNREQQVLQGFAAGKTKRAIASEMEICSRTVEIRLRTAMKKLGLNSQVELMRFALLAYSGLEAEAWQSEHRKTTFLAPVG